MQVSVWTGQKVRKANGGGNDRGQREEGGREQTPSRGQTKVMLADWPSFFEKGRRPQTIRPDASRVGRQSLRILPTYRNPSQHNKALSDSVY